MLYPESGWPNDICKPRARLQQILSSTPAVVYTCTPCRDRSATFVSDNIIEQFGYTPAAFLAEPDFWLGRVHSEDLPTFFAI